ncbi:hypothetical protein OKA04_09845 [Luteolibacter flavescens]|uniref:Uncharacterized protein n=1 Tax=Luteolibacter flavescens TaxID=1859460 RepID=A0ABT3FNW2_9BACT|nr:hypothetical protein [Luteolibacter flavescens]MCW1885029.1 hypothetical protein [Luteolibacter flavescens]
MMRSLWTVVVSLALVCHVSGWIHEEPVDHSKQLASSQFAGIVEVTSLTDTGEKRRMFDYKVAFREVKVALKVLSHLKGEKKGELAFTVYREPTEEELVADGMSREDAFQTSLNLGCDERLHLYLVKVRRRDHLMVYLKKSGDGFSPVAGDEKASRSIHRMEEANVLNPSAGSD